MTEKTQTALDMNTHPALLINQKSRLLLEEADLEHFIDAPLDLAAARKVGHALETSGAHLFLFAQLNAAIRCMCCSYLEHHDFQPGWKTFLLGGTRYRCQGLGEAFRLFQRHYPIRRIPAAALRADGRGRQIGEARQKLAIELCLLDTQSENPALRPLHSLFMEKDPARRQVFQQIVDRLSELPGDTKAPPLLRQPLRTLLRAPMQAAPDDLTAQVTYAIEHWGTFLPADLLRSLTVARAIVLEEAQSRLPGPGPDLLPDHAGSPERWEPAAFSADTDWMPNAVLLAKSIHVWLGQLSRSYGCRINTLDQIPDDALDRLAGWGFNALWLIGIWERSGASRKIKQMHGNPEAEASAYALYSYRVAADLGGEPALDNLEARCASRGIRLACDVVPNHTGIDSEWIQQHPDWFVQCDTPPYPAYSFKGTDLCDNPGISIHIEEGYWDHSDAAVVFEHFDHHSGRHRYIYHGNDGTHMPWNDTAQLNFLLPEVRQAMSDLILETAKRFRLIRFDAAMTLARKHFRRLWFPPPGGSAGVSSRSAFWMEDADFDKAFPREFWRDVVDRVNREAPNTLLIAEAFWLMESYFVRNLGMHRVYNSAFMNLLKREENAKYRRILKDVLAYNPGILKRYVNFMNNPDEATAVEQFDKGDKYFGTAVLLVTLPGLPMFGHGQIEGFREKYGMEFRRAYWNEEPDTGFITHHEAQIFPLLRRRYLFSDVAQFALYDFEASDGVDENVFAFSNGTDTEHCLVVYNNSPSPTRGKLCTSVPKAPPDSEGQAMPGKPLIEELGLTASNAAFCSFRNHRDNRESLRSLAEMYEGLEITLGPYQYDVYYDFRLLDDASGAWRKLCDHLGGQPVASLDEAILGFRHYELWAATQHLFSPDRLQTLAENLTSFPLSDAVLTILDTMNADLDKLAKQLAATLGRSEPERSGSALRIRFGKLARQLEKGKSQAATSSGLEALWNSSLHRGLVYPLFCWQVCDELIARVYTDHDPVQLITDFKRFGLTMAWRETLPAAQRQRDPALVELLLLTAKSCPHPAESRPAFEALFTRPEMHGLLGINQHEGETWFDQDRMEDLCCALVLQRLCLPTGSDIVLAKDIERYKCRIEHAAASGYRLDKFLNLT